MAERYRHQPTPDAYQALGQVYCFRGDIERGLSVFSDGVAIFEPDPTDSGVIALYCCLGGYSPVGNSPDSPMSIAVRTAEESGSSALLAAALLARGGTLLEDLDVARADFERVQMISTDATALVFSDLGLGRITDLAADYRTAASRYESSIRLAIDSGMVSTVSSCAAALSRIAARMGVREGVAELFGTALAIEERSGGVLHNNWQDDLVDIERDLVALGIDLDRSEGVFSDRDLRHLVQRVAEASLEAID